MKAVSANTAWLLTGGNMDRRSENLERAYGLIAEHCGEIIHASRVYETAAWGREDQPPFLNQALEISTALTPLQLLDKTLHIEKILGRRRKEKYGPRIIDIDILFYNDDILNEPTLKVPHPHLAGRRFVLVPLAEIAPALIHPVLHKSIPELLARCPDQLPVTIFSGQ
jgi:2-amino-4-hydroxy-6-hydroxymethyldihydropteridine diphosphokinase